MNNFVSERLQLHKTRTMLGWNPLTKDFKNLSFILSYITCYNTRIPFTYFLLIWVQLQVKQPRKFSMKIKMLSDLLSERSLENKDMWIEEEEKLNQKSRRVLKKEEW